MVAIQPRVAFVVGLALTASASPYAVLDDAHPAQKAVDDSFARAMDSPSRNMDSPSHARTAERREDKEARSMLWPIKRSDEAQASAIDLEIFPEDDDPFVEKRSSKAGDKQEKEKHISARSPEPVRYAQPRDVVEAREESAATLAKRRHNDHDDHHGHYRHHHHHADYWYYDDEPDHHIPYSVEHIHLHEHIHERRSVGRAAHRRPHPRSEQEAAKREFEVADIKDVGSVERKLETVEKRRHRDHEHRHHHHYDDYWVYDDEPEVHYVYNDEHVHLHTVTEDVHTVYEERKRSHARDVFA